MKGEELRNARLRKQLTQERFGMMVGYERKSAERVVQLWEHDKQPVPIKYWRKVSEILEIPLDRFIP